MFVLEARAMPRRRRRATVAIYKLFEDASFGPDEIARMSSAYEMTLVTLQLANRTDPITQLIAAKVIQLFRAGQSDPALICQKIISEVRVE
jgi:hypothetical protein